MDWKYATGPTKDALSSLLIETIEESCVVLDGSAVSEGCSLRDFTRI